MRMPKELFRDQYGHQPTDNDSDKFSDSSSGDLNSSIIQRDSLIGQNK